MSSNTRDPTPDSPGGSTSGADAHEDTQLTIRIPNPKMYMARQSQWKGRRGKPRCDHCRLNNLKVRLSALPSLSHSFICPSAIGSSLLATTAPTAKVESASTHRSPLQPTVAYPVAIVVVSRISKSKGLLPETPFTRTDPDLYSATGIFPSVTTVPRTKKAIASILQRSVTRFPPGPP